MKKFKKIYIEITNKCNLSCSFCPKDEVIKKDISLEEFENILKKIDNYTEYVYLHVKGEPLIHPDFNGIIKLCKKYNKSVNITTNGTMLKYRINELEDIRQINISLQSLTNIEKLYEIIEVVDKLSKSTYISYRLWTDSNIEKEILNILEKRYNQKITKGINLKLDEKVFINFEEEFVWPDLNNKIIRKEGTCYGTREHIAILVDGTVIPCCLDSKGIINLGNIFKNSLDEISNTVKFTEIKNGFENNKLKEELCKKCGFFNRKQGSE